MLRLGLLRRRWLLLVSVLALLAGVFGMHVLGGAHQSHHGDTALLTVAADDHGSLILVGSESPHADAFATVHTDSAQQSHASTARAELECSRFYGHWFRLPVG